ncbi:hypothetical protein ABPS01_09200 [Streptococcus sp. ZJ151]
MILTVNSGKFYRNRNSVAKSTFLRLLQLGVAVKSAGKRSGIGLQ